MTTRIGLGGWGVLLLLALALLGAWAYWGETPPRDAWNLDESERVITDVLSEEKVSASFRLCNTANVPRRIVGASIC